MRTIPNRYPYDSSVANKRSMCDVCGVMYYRTDLVRGEDGLLHCPNHLEDDYVALSEENASWAEAYESEFNYIMEDSFE